MSNWITGFILDFFRKMIWCVLFRDSNKEMVNAYKSVCVCVRTPKSQVFGLKCKMAATCATAVVAILLWNIMFRKITNGILCEAYNVPLYEIAFLVEFFFQLGSTRLVSVPLTPYLSFSLNFSHSFVCQTSVSNFNTIS